MDFIVYGFVPVQG